MAKKSKEAVEEIKEVVEEFNEEVEDEKNIGRSQKRY